MLMAKTPLKQYALPTLFGLTTVSYFLPFMITFHIGQWFSVLFSIVWLVWAALFISLWLYSLILIIKAVWKKEVNHALFVHCALIWSVYGVWWFFANKGYVITV